ncbi:MAG: hypothetical protein GWO23_20865, partial [Gammaproteobacteria bacterium]|nr:hypothetical protein [Gammaproteobacteria bacterium]NIR26513.1 hypothetical protein [Gammaproteobacteria bacterium]
PALGAVLGQGDTATLIPGLDEVAKEIQGAINDEETKVEQAAAPKADKRDLPAPPDRPAKKTSFRTAAKTIGGVAAGLTITVGSGGDELFRLISRYGMAAGVVPAVAAVALFW